MKHGCSLFLVVSILVSAISGTEYPKYSTDFTIINNQTHTSGHVFIKSPAPWGVVGGDALTLQLDITAGGKVPLPPYKDDAENAMHSISLFLTSIITGLNITIHNISPYLSYYNQQTLEYRQNYTGHYNDTLTLWQEPDSALKTVTFRWPQCFVAGSGFMSSSSPSIEFQGQSYRGGLPVGAYNISLHQLYRVGGEEKFSVFNLPIVVRGDIGQGEDEKKERFSCFSLGSGIYKGNEHNWGEELSAERPWADGKGSMKAESKDVEEVVSWPREETEVERKERGERMLAAGYGDVVVSAAAEEGGKTETTDRGNGEVKTTENVETGTSQAGGPRQTAALSLGVMVAGLVVVL